MKTMITLATLGSALALTACGDASQDTNEAQANMNGMPANGEMMGDGEMMSNMQDEMAGTMDGHKMTSSTGTVTAIDAKAGKVTLDHAAIAAANWPAMTMEFDAKPEVLQDIKVGDTVSFDVTIKNGANEVTAIAKRQQ